MTHGHSTGQPVVVITGSSSGLGAECANVLRERGWHAIGLDLAAPSSDMAHVSCDVSSEQAVGAAFRTIKEWVGAINALVCSAGVSRLGRAEDCGVDDFDRIMAVNFRGAWLCARAALPLLRPRAKAESPGNIVFVSSVAALRPKVGNAIYGGSKAALNHLTRVMAGELGPEQIRVNAIAPSWMDTPMTRTVVEGAGYRRSQMPPLGRQAQTRDAALMIAAVLSSDWTFTTGMVIPVDGGASQVYTPELQ